MRDAVAAAVLRWLRRAETLAAGQVTAVRDRLRAQLSDSTAAPANVAACDAVGRTALHYCGGYGEREAAALLLKQGALVNAPDRFGVTPLHWACLKAHVPLVDLLEGDVAASAGRGPVARVPVHLLLGAVVREPVGHAAAPRIPVLS